MYCSPMSTSTDLLVITVSEDENKRDLPGDEKEMNGEGQKKGDVCAYDVCFYDVCSYDVCAYN